MLSNAKTTRSIGISYHLFYAYACVASRFRQGIVLFGLFYVDSQGSCTYATSNAMQRYVPLPSLLYKILQPGVYYTVVRHFLIVYLPHLLQDMLSSSTRFWLPISTSLVWVIRAPHHAAPQCTLHCWGAGEPWWKAPWKASMPLSCLPLLWAHDASALLVPRIQMPWQLLWQGHLFEINSLAYQLPVSLLLFAVYRPFLQSWLSRQVLWQQQQQPAAFCFSWQH